MDKIIRGFILEYKAENKKRFNLSSLEKHVIDRLGGYSSYNSKGGYLKLYDGIILWKKKQYIREIDSSVYNGLNPSLKTRWQIIWEEEVVDRWDRGKMLQLSDLLDFSYYRRQPAYQTDREWQYILNIYKFLKSRKHREWASVEERSLELFHDEKFLKDRKDRTKGRYGILKRLKLSLEDLKMKDYGEMFIYWNRGVEHISKIIILENHSSFFSYKRIAEKGREIFDFQPDALIYGEGKKIEKSLSFLEEIADLSGVEVLYFGDMDSEGYGIYYRLKERYSAINLSLQHEAYIDLLSLNKKHYPLGRQEKNPEYLKFFLEEMGKYLDDSQVQRIKYIWDRDYRIPQELVNYEYLLKVKK